MGVLLKTCLVGIGAIALGLIVGFGWLFFSSSGLPDTLALAQFAPATLTQVTGPCRKSASVAIPYDSIGDNLRSALGVAEAKEDDPRVIADAYRWFSDQNRAQHASLSLQIARTMFCDPGKQLSRQLNEIRSAVQLERHFTRRELFTIYANRLVFGEKIIGVEAAAQHFYRKEPNHLLVGEAALLAALVKAPSYFSPTKHPDRALERRNEVIAALLETHAISESDASTAKASPLPVVTD